MSIEDPTFGCGTFLPGVGPGNFPDFDGGGTIDAGGGEEPPGGPDVVKGDPVDETEPEPGDGGPPGGFPTWPNEIEIITDDPQGGWVDNNYPPTGWDDNFKITTIDILDDNFNVPTYGGTQYVPTWDDNGVITFPTIPIDFDEGTEPTQITVTIEYPSTWPGDETVFTGSWEPTIITIDDKGGSDGPDFEGEKVDGGGPIGGEGLEQDSGFSEGETPGTGTVVIGGGGTETGYDTTSLGGDFTGGVSTGVLAGGGVTVGEEPGEGTVVIESNPYAGQTVTILYNDPTGGSTTLSPTSWGPTDSVDYIQVENSSGGFVTYGGTIYGWDQIGGTGVTLGSNGEIIFDHIPIAFDDVPTQVLIIVNGKNWYTSIVISEYTNGGGGGGTGGGGGGTGTGGGEPGGEGQGGGTEPFTAGLPQKLSKNTRGGLISDAKSSNVIDLDDPKVRKNILKKKPTGLQDSDVAFLMAPPEPTMVRNTTGHIDIFADMIDSNISYVLKNRRNVGDWDSTRAAGVTPQAVLNSLRPDIKSLLEQILNYDGTSLTPNQVYNMIGTRILDGSVSRINLKYLKNLAENSKKRIPVVIKPSRNNTVNEVAAAALIDRNKFTLDPTKASGRMANVLPNWKTLATDIDQYLPITLGGEEKRFYIHDDTTFINGVDLKVQDGNYVDITRGGKTQRIFTKSEIDHAFILPEKTRQQALSLLGAGTGRTLEVSAPATLSGLEFNYSLSAPRQNFYVLSAVLSSINTTPSPVGSFLLKNSTIQYDLVDTSTTAGLENLNSYIKYKANHRVFILDDEDLIFDYLDGLSSLTVKQTDILFDSPKTNKTIPLLTRQIPWYILLYPTNRSDYNLFNSKSRLITVNPDGSTIRSLGCRTTIVPEFSKRNTNKFARIRTDGKSAVDVLGNANTQTRITKISPTDTVFKTGYKKRNEFVEAETFSRTRKKTGYRLVKEIITELNNNYLLSLNAIGKSVTEFDVFSRLYLSQFNRLSKLENFVQIRDAIRRGLISGVKVIPPIRHSDGDISYRSTLLVRRKAGASEDTFTPIKGTRNRETIVPPTSTGGATSAPVPSPTTPS